MKVPSPFWPSVKWLAVLAPLFLQAANAATLTSDTVAVWEAYVRDARSRIHESLQPGRQFLSLDKTESTAEKIRGGEPVVIPSGRTPQKVPSGLIHDWQGITFIPDAKIDDVLSVVRDYAHYTEFYHPAVIDSKALRSGATDRFSMLLVDRSLLLKTALDGDYESTYVRIDDRRWYSISKTTRIQEIQNYGTPAQRTLSENEGTGLIWKLLSITRFEQRDGGVYIEVEAIALSRDIPPSFRWIVTPIVRRMSKASLSTSLQQTAGAVYSRQSLPARSAAGERRVSASQTGGGSPNSGNSFH